MCRLYCASDQGSALNCSQTPVPTSPCTVFSNMPSSDMYVCMYLAKFRMVATLHTELSLGIMCVCACARAHTQVMTDFEWTVKGKRIQLLPYTS
jgi:hypothetical protein